MPTSFHTASAGVFTRMLTNLQGVLAKAEANATERKFSPDNFVGLRLSPDMHGLAFQIQSATDRSKLFLSRVSGVAAPSWPDTEKTWEEIKARLETGLDFAKSIAPAQIDGLDDKL